MNLENKKNKTKSRLVTILIFALFAISILYFVPIKSAKAFSNNQSNHSDGACGAGSSFTIGTIGTTVGDLIVFQIASYTGTANNKGVFASSGFFVSSITDVSGDTYSAVNSQSSTGYVNQDNGLMQAFKSQAVSTSTGTITITFTGSVANCKWSWSSYNTDALGFFTVGYTSFGLICTYGTPFGSATPSSFGACNGPADIANQQTNGVLINNIPSDSIIDTFSVTNCQSIGGQSPLYVTNGAPAPEYINLPSQLVGQFHDAHPCDSGITTTTNMYLRAGGWAYYATAQTQQQFNIIGNIGLNAFCNFGGCVINSQGAGGVAWFTSFSCTVNFVSNTCYNVEISVSMLLIVFNGNGTSTSSGGTLLNGCSFNPIANASTHTGFLKSNQTVFFYGQTTNGQIFTNFTVYIKSVTAQSTGDILNLNIYTVGNQFGITPFNPLAILFTKSFNLPTTATAFKISVSPQLALPNNGQYAFGLSARHNGIKLFRGNTGLTLYNDTADGYNPLTITNLANPQVNSMCMFGLIVFPSITTTVTQGTGGVGGTATTTITATITQLASPVGGALIISDLVTFLPIWILPLLFTALLRTTAGLLFGLMIALLLGVFMGLFPFWTIFIVIIMIYLLLR